MVDRNDLVLVPPFGAAGRPAPGQGPAASPENRPFCASFGTVMYCEFIYVTYFKRNALTNSAWRGISELYRRMPVRDRLLEYTP